MSKMVGRQYLNSKRLNSILTGTENHKKPVGKVRFTQPDGSVVWYSLFAATHKDGTVRTTRFGEIELNVRTQEPRVPAERLVEPEANYQDAWADKQD